MVEPTRFAWAAPAGATQLKPDAPELTGLVASGGGGGAGGVEGDVPAQALVGKPAPDFKLEDASGKAVALADLKGGVVVIDFWATWCPPCREELPHLDKLAADRAGDGVKVFAINLREDPDKVARFVSTTNLKLPVLFDFNGQVGEKYLVDGIPQTVIIDKQGNVRHVSVGWGGDESVGELSAAIDAALKQ
jgi:peroxiredoxin